MKINAVSNTYTHNNKNNLKVHQNTPAFGKAKVQILTDVVDSISSMRVYSSDGLIDRLAQKLQPALEKLDDNLRITVTGTQKLKHFWQCFQDIRGLKVDIQYFDQKKAYYDILERSSKENLLKNETIKGLKNKDETLLRQLGEKIGVGKFFRPKTETEGEYVEKLAAMIERDVKDMPVRLLESKNIEQRADGTFAAFSGGNFLKGEDYRNVCSWYRGIEY